MNLKYIYRILFVLCVCQLLCGCGNNTAKNKDMVVMGVYSTKTNEACVFTLNNERLLTAEIGECYEAPQLTNEFMKTVITKEARELSSQEYTKIINMLDDFGGGYSANPKSSTDTYIIHILYKNIESSQFIYEDELIHKNETYNVLDSIDDNSDKLIVAAVFDEFESKFSF